MLTDTASSLIYYVVYELLVALGVAVRTINKVTKREINNMLTTIAIILAVLWALGYFAVDIGGSLIHILLVGALIAFIYSMVAGRRSV